MSFCKSRRLFGASLSARASVLSLAIAVLGGGCAATNSGPSKVAGPVYPGDAPPPPSIARSAPVEMEADGLPAQVAPRNRRPMKDEPTEPWSPNYGTVHSTVSDAAPIGTKVAAAAPASPVATQSAAPRLAPDDIIRLAIAEHEMRQR
jgi:hypothetical protein